MLNVRRYSLTRVSPKQNTFSFLLLEDESELTLRLEHRSSELFVFGSFPRSKVRLGLEVRGVVGMLFMDELLEKLLLDDVSEELFFSRLR